MEVEEDDIEGGLTGKGNRLFAGGGEGGVITDPLKAAQQRFREFLVIIDNEKTRM
jgi:hypothetical protein